MILPKISFPAEWAPQSAIMLTFPHKDTDWKPYLGEAMQCFAKIARTIVRFEKLLIVCCSANEVKAALGDVDYSQIVFCEIQTNDTWARDHAPVSLFIDKTPVLLDFAFNGWGLKFPANHDNQITRRLFDCHIFSPEVQYQNMQQFILEGGSIESDGQGTLLTTSQCLLSPNRNVNLDKTYLEAFFKTVFGLNRVLWLDHGYLVGDDTDSHIDTLARFCDTETIAYVKCTDKKDVHFKALSAMGKQLQSFSNAYGKPYRLLPLPMAEPVYFEGKRLPATYANFLIINGAVLYPTYNSNLDKIAGEQLQKAFTDREIIGIDCLPLIRQHGSLHCVTMQFPKRFLS
ncbi:MAG: agmatine deiminase family protein [Dysgonamonadaceae bacterium]|jgi:agmatine/peptidylarginine deiminase|nr:agmatine deiminase family protein [Dysgonamonadaceae bacterium]